MGDRRTAPYVPEEPCSSRTCCRPIRLGGGGFARYEGCHQVWRFPLAARAVVCRALEAAAGVRCEVEELHPVPRAYLEVMLPPAPHTQASARVGFLVAMQGLSLSLSGSAAGRSRYWRDRCTLLYDSFNLVRGSGAVLLSRARDC